MAGSMKLSGFKELERDLLRLAEKDAKRIGRRAVRKGAKPMLAAARANAPVKSGRLRRSIKLRVDMLRGATALGRVLSAMIHVKDRQGYRPRKTDRQSRVKGKLGPARYNYQIGSLAEVYGKFVEGEVGRPGQAPQPFLRPAFDGNINRSVQIAADDMMDGITAALKG